jgi:molybdopterin molybdotransferase
MLPVSQAQQLVLQHTTRRPVEPVALTTQTLGLVLAEDVVSDIDMPPYEKALMDGFAVRAADVSLPPGARQAGSGEAAMPMTSLMLKVVEEVSAGRVPRFPIRAGQASRIMTGAMLPPGADTVVALEKVEVIGGGKSLCIIEQIVKPGQNVMQRGREMRAGETVLQAGVTLRPQELALLASVGRYAIEIYRPPLVNILSTGDELVEPSVEPGPGQIRNSNATLLSAQAVRAGGKPQYLGIARDTVESLRVFITEGLRGDVLLLTGGVSAGKLDLVPGVLQELGVQPIFHKVAMKPGKPLFFGKKDDTLIFGLPGNPVSALVGFELFVRPALNVMLGKEPGPRLVTAKLSAAADHSGDRQTYHPAQLTQSSDGWLVCPVPWLGSPDLRAITRANAFIVFEPGERKYSPGEAVLVLAPE